MLRLNSKTATEDLRETLSSKRLLGDGRQIRIWGAKSLVWIGTEKRGG
jgi:hypothetical protein